MNRAKRAIPPALLLVGLLIAIALTGGPSLHAQGQGGRQHPRMSVDQAICLWREETTGTVERTRGREAVSAMLNRRKGYNDAHADSIVDALQRLSLVSAAPRIRTAAAVLLGLAGEAAFVSRPIPHLFDRLENVFQRSADPSVRNAVIDAMLRQADTARAVRLLTRVAVSDPADEAAREEPWRAIAHLSRMGSPGQAALRALHRDRRVREPNARGYLQVLAERDFRPVGPPPSQ
jgi:hypothetical protein